MASLPPPPAATRAATPAPASAATLRSMQPADLKAARALWAATEGVELAEGDSEAELTCFLARNPGTSHVAVLTSGELVGAVLAGFDGRRGLLYHLSVAPAHRGGGLGGALVERCLTALRAAGAVRVLILVDRDNASGRAFWLRRGWSPISFAEPFGRDL